MPLLKSCDSIISAGTEGLAVAAPAPGSDCLLPCTDVDWDQGNISTNEPLLAESFNVGVSLGSFARTCQAAHMLDKVLAHVGRRKNDVGQDATEVLVEAIQLHTALQALDASLIFTEMPTKDSYLSPETPMPARGGEDGHHQCAMALCCSARFLLYSEYGCSDFNARTPSCERVALESEAQGIAIREIEHLAAITVPRLARAVVQTSAAVVTRQTINPLLGHCMYYAATECACFIKESHIRDMHAALTHIVQGLKAVQSEWEVGGMRRFYLFFSILRHG